MEQLTIPVGPLQCNCYILWKKPSEAIVIDPGDEGERLLQVLQDRGLTPRLVVNTHGHFDHVGGVDALRNRYQIPYKIHRADVPILQMVPARSKIWGITVPDIPEPREFLAPGEAFEHGGLRVEVLHTPGHTPGSTSFYVADADAVFTGDTLFLQSIGRTDFPGGDYDQEIDSIRKKLLPLPPKTVVNPGHGPPSTVGFEARSNPFVS